MTSHNGPWSSHHSSITHPRAHRYWWLVSNWHRIGIVLAVGPELIVRVVAEAQMTLRRR